MQPASVAQRDEHKEQLAETTQLDVARGDFHCAVIEGLSRQRKSLPPQYFYDARGSELFEDITRLPEYYQTRTEAAILSAHAAEITENIASDGVLVEFGSGSSLKTEMLLAELAPGVAYVPIDVSASALDEARARLAHRFPHIGVHPIAGTFSRVVPLPTELSARPRTGFFPGSTIGNFTPADAIALLRTFQKTLKANSSLIIGIDLKKDARQLVLAYNDSAGVTAAFNLNILARINRELGAAIDLSTFRHEAVFDPRQGRIEMHLVSAIAQDVCIGGLKFRFARGESIHTENSYKYTVAEFSELAFTANWTTQRVWRDDAQQFAVIELTSAVAQS